MNDPEHRFEAAMASIYKRAKAECGYNASRYLQLLSEKGGLATAKQLIRVEGGTDGFTRLWSLKRLDLSVEALVISEEFRPLFTEEERELCRDRLAQYNYQP